MVHSAFTGFTLAIAPEIAYCIARTSQVVSSAMPMILTPGPQIRASASRAIRSATTVNIYNGSSGTTALAIASETTFLISPKARSSAGHFIAAMASPNTDAAAIAVTTFMTGGMFRVK